MADKNVISIDKIKVACRDCSLSTLCLPMGLRPEDVDRLDAIVKRSRPMQRGDHIFRSGEAFRHLYVVKTGAVKTFPVERPVDTLRKRLLESNEPVQLSLVQALDVAAENSRDYQRQKEQLYLAELAEAVAQLRTIKNIRQKAGRS